MDYEKQRMTVLKLLKAGASVKYVSFLMEWTNEDIEKVKEEENIEHVVKFDPDLSIILEYYRKSQVVKQDHKPKVEEDLSLALDQEYPKSTIILEEELIIEELLDILLRRKSIAYRTIRSVSNERFLLWSFIWEDPHTSVSNLSSTKPSMESSVNSSGESFANPPSSFSVEKE
jgi:hypothetical protein